MKTGLSVSRVLLFVIVVCAVALATNADPKKPGGGDGGPCPRHFMCPDVWDPVICSDGHVYSNDCYARRACATGCVPYGDDFVVDKKKPGGDCPRHIYCLDVWDPVICDDGHIYSNACYAYRACATGCVPYGDDEMADKKKPDGDSGCPRHIFCPDVWDPVICDDGHIYSNACYAYRACATGCVPYGDDGPIILDKKKPGWDDGCPRHIFCLDVWDPVICDDGHIYSNACYAYRACATGCVPYGDDVSVDKKKPGGGCPRHIMCPDVWDPVICSDGHIYSNACYAYRACATGCVPYGDGGPIPLE